MNTIYKAAVITVSDTGSKGEREDVSGRVIEEILKNAGFDCVSYQLVPDERADISEAIRTASKNANLVLTTGGTGFSHRDVTPEATKDVIEKEAQGIAEAVRAYSMKITPRAMLSRGVAGIVGDSLIINLPGAPKAVREALEYILPSLGHGLDILCGNANNCAR
jgi:molybdenum cofactor synthesis domain-containing protein